MHKRFKHHYLLIKGALLSLLLLAGCAAPDEVCIEADNFGQTQSTTTTIDANNSEWVSSGISVSQGKSLTIKTSGTIYICSSGVEGNTADVTVNANTHAWTNTGFTIHDGDAVSIVVGAPSSDAGAAGNKWSTWDGLSGASYPAPTAWVDSGTNSLCSSEGAGGCWNTEGQGLKARVGTDYPASYSSTVNSNGTYSGTNPANAPGVFSLNVNSGVYSNTDTSSGTAEITSLGSGTLYLRINDCNNPGRACYGDNTGGYTVNIRVYPCPAIDGKASTAYAPAGSLEAKIMGTGENPNDGDTGTDLSLTDGQYSDNASVDGTVWLRVNDTDYSDNSESYSVEVESETFNTSISNWIQSKIIEPVANQLNTAVKTMFNNMVIDSGLVKGVKAMLLLYIVIYCIMFIFGMVQLNQLDLVVRIFKISLMVALISPGSWDFFNDHAFKLFKEGSLQLLANATGAFNHVTGTEATTVSSPFGFIDKTVGIFFNKETWLKLLGLFFVFPIGWAYIAMIFYSLSTYVVAIAQAILGYLLALVAISTLLCVAPIFLCFMMFEFTKGFFDSWKNYLIRYALEPVIMIISLVIFNEFIVVALYGVIGYNVCWKCALPIKFGELEITCIHYFMPWGYDAEGKSTMDFFLQYPFMLVSILVLLIFTNLSKTWCTFVSRVSALLSSTNALMGTNIYGKNPNEQALMKKAWGGATDGLKSLVGMDGSADGKDPSKWSGSKGRRAVEDMKTASTEADTKAKASGSKEDKAEARELADEAAHAEKDMEEKKAHGKEKDKDEGMKKERSGLSTTGGNQGGDGDGDGSD